MCLFVSDINFISTSRAQFNESNLEEEEGSVVEGEGKSGDEVASFNFLGRRCVLEALKMMKFYHIGRVIKTTGR